MKKKLLRFLRANLALFLLLVGTTVFAQSGGVSGVIKNSKGTPLAGSTLRVQGRNTNAIADANGKYSIQLPTGEYNISVAFVGHNVSFFKVSVVSGATVTKDVVLVEATDLSEITVVGSRSKVARTNIATAVPVDVVSIKEVKNFAQADVTQLLTYAAPSFQSARQTISDGTDHIDPAGLRGLGPDQTLVLLNGKRRHNTALVNINGTVGRGSVGTDMNAIPVAAIERIEILRDGAAAQYGSDAIAGVINIVLKKRFKGLNVSVMSGQNMTNMPINGNKISINDGLNKQVDLVGGYSNDKYYVTGSFQFLSREQSNRSGFDNIPLVYLGNGGGFPNAPTGVATNDFRRWLIDQDKAVVAQKGYNTQNIVAGNSASSNYGGFVNTGYKLTSKTEVYVSAGLSGRTGFASGFSRNPNSWNQQPVLANGSRFYENGFLPVINTTINDGSVLAGIKTELKGWALDFSNTYGSNSVEFDISNTGNASLAATNSVQTKINAGKISFNQNTINADASKRFELGDNNALNVAFGIENRTENYKIKEGELNSYTNGGRLFSVPSITYTPTGQVVNIAGGPTAPGAQVFPGFQPGDATDVRRTVNAIYADFEYTRDKVIAGFAARYENYQEKNTSYNGTGLKFSLKYDLCKNLAIRGSASTGFRAPSLQQRYFQNQSTQFVAGLPTTVLTANNENPITKNAFGIQDLKPEYSFGYTLGLVGKLSKTTTFTIDAYSIDINDRIVLSTQFSRGSSNARVNQILTAANIDPAVSSVQFWTNAINTRTQGLDVVVTQSYRSGQLNGNISLAANFNNNQVIGGVNTNSAINSAINNPSETDATRDPSQDFKNLLFDRQQRSRVEIAQPRDKVVLTGTLNYKKFSAMARAVRFGEVSTVNQLDPNAKNSSGVYFNDAAFETDQTFSAKITTDLVLTYRFYKSSSFSVGANNLFDVYPDQVFVDSRNSASNVYANPTTTTLASTPNFKTAGGYAAARDLSNRGRFLFNANQFGFNGRYIYARIAIEIGDFFGK